MKQRTGTVMRMRLPCAHGVPVRAVIAGPGDGFSDTSRLTRMLEESPASIACRPRARRMSRPVRAARLPVV